jgi:hypothetical protein
MYMNTTYSMKQSAVAMRKRMSKKHNNTNALWSAFCDFRRLLRTCITKRKVEQNNFFLGVWCRRSFPILITRVLTFFSVRETVYFI